MKKRIRGNLPIILALITTVIFSVGASMWLIIFEGSESPNHTNTPKVTPYLEVKTLDALYEGESFTRSNFCVARPSSSDTSTELAGTYYYRNSADYTENAEGGWLVLGNNFNVSFGDSHNSEQKQITYQIRFVPDKSIEGSYNEARSSNSITVNAVAHIDSNYYGTVDKALAQANASNSGTVTVIPIVAGATDSNKATLESRAQKAKTIKNTTSISSGVTLSLPWIHSTNGETILTHDESKYSDLLARGGNNGGVKGIGNFSYKVNLTTPLRNNLVYLNSNLSNKGTIKIGGHIDGSSGGTSASFTGGNFAELQLQKGATLTSTGTIDCYGYITEADDYVKGESSPVTIKSGGQITSPFFVYEHRGGSIFAGMAHINISFSGIETNLKTSPFNRFFLPNVMPKTAIEYGASVYGFADLYANDAHNVTKINMVGTSGTEMISLSSGAKLIYDYNDNNIASTQENNISINVQIKGSASINPLALTVSAPLIGEIPLSTEDVFLPISQYYNITLSPFENGAQSTITANNQDIKIMAGATVTVEKGVTANLQGVIVHSQIYQEPGTSGLFPYKDITNAFGALIINGTLNATGIGGLVQSTQTGGVATAQNTSVAFDELQSVTDSTPYDTPGYNSATETFTYYACNLDGTISKPNEVNASAGTTYYSKVFDGLTEAGWHTTPPININFVTNCDNISFDSLVNVDAFGGYPLSKLPQLSEANKPYNTFMGWYYENGTKVTSNITQSCTLHAEWVLNTYEITFNSVKTQVPTNPVTIQYSAGMNTALPDFDITNDGYIFAGWYYDQDLTKAAIDYPAVFRYAYNNGLVNENGEANIALYAKWVQGYIVYFSVNNAKHSPVGTNIHMEVFESLAEAQNYNISSIASYAQVFYDNDSDSSFTTYFTGNWNTASDGSGTTLSGTLSSLISEAVKVYTVYAIWDSKYEVTYKSDHPNKSDLDNVNGKTVYIHPNEFKNDEYILATDAISTLGLSTELDAYDTDTNERYYYGGIWYTGSTQLTTVSTSNFTDKKLTVSVLWAEKLTVTISTSNVSSCTVKVNGVTVSANEFYVISGTTVSITASKSNTKTGIFGASATAQVTVKANNEQLDDGKPVEKSGWPSATATDTHEGSVTITEDTSFVITGS